MTLATVHTLTNRSALAILDAADEWTDEIFIPGGMLLDVSIVASGFTGTIKLQRRLSSTPSYEFITNSTGADLAWTGDATPIVQQATGHYVRAYASALSAGFVTVTLRAGNRE